MREFILGAIFGGIICLLLISMASIAIAQQVYHSASEIRPGTFYGGGSYIFPSTSNLIIGGNFTPASSGAVDLGNSTHRFRNIYLNGSYGSMSGVI